MIDIAERLRLYARHFEDLHAPQNVTIGMREAAAEIEHLREEAEFNYMAGYDAAKDDYRDMLQERENEIERLRAALREAYEVYAGSDGFIPETASEGYQQQVIKQMVNCISAALEDKP